eukprot:gene2714-1699_t
MVVDCVVDLWILVCADCWVLVLVMLPCEWGLLLVVTWSLRLIIVWNHMFLFLGGYGTVVSTWNFLLILLLDGFLQLVHIPSWVNLCGLWHVVNWCLDASVESFGILVLTDELLIDIVCIFYVGLHFVVLSISFDLGFALDFCFVLGASEVKFNSLFPNSLTFMNRVLRCCRGRLCDAYCGMWVGAVACVLRLMRLELTLYYGLCGCLQFDLRLQC